MEEKLYIYIDESGDTGIKFDKGSSRFFVLALVHIKDTNLQKIYQELFNIILSLKINSEELKFSKTSFKNKRLFFKNIKKLDFIADIFIFNKQMKKDYSYYVLKCVNSLNINSKFKEILVTIDGIDENILTHQDVKQIKKVFKSKVKIIFCNSIKNIFLQLADMLAGLIHSIYKDKNDYITMLKNVEGKIKITHIK
jgi:hypothetical protein